VLIPVKNEAANLRDCLASVFFPQEIVIVHSASTDVTQAIAEAAGARVVQFVWNGKLPRKKNWALEKYPLAIRMGADHRCGRTHHATGT
jgi:glycosyltransferase involved in cell wall biosynthesis